MFDVMRGIYLLNCLLVGSGVWAKLICCQQPWNPITGVVFCFLAVLSALSALGVRYPLAVLHLLYIQLFYKTFWLIAMYVPLHAVVRSNSLLAKSGGKQ